MGRLGVVQRGLLVGTYGGYLMALALARASKHLRDRCGLRWRTLMERYIEGIRGRGNAIRDR